MSTDPSLPLTQIAAISYVTFGILFSLLLPVCVSILKGAKLEDAREPSLSVWSRLADAWRRYGGNRYLLMLAAATVVAIALVIFLDMHFNAARDAAVAGFAWESLLNKLSSKG